MLISYDAYRVFYTVARLGSFTKAAGALLSSQPNLTRTIRNLESALGCTLFVRSNRGAVLTPEGEKLFARVSVACEQIQAGEEELARACFCPCSARATAPIRGFACGSPTIPRLRRFPRCETAWWMSPSSPLPQRTPAACTSSRSANSRKFPSAARR